MHLFSSQGPLPKEETEAGIGENERAVLLTMTLLPILAGCYLFTTSSTLASSNLAVLVFLVALSSGMVAAFRIARHAESAYLRGFGGGMASLCLLITVMVMVVARV